MRKTSEFRSKPFLEEKKPWNSVPNHFWNRKNFGIPFRMIFGREKTLEFHSESFSEEKKLWKETTIVSCFVKLNYFAEFRTVPFRSELLNGLFRNTWNHT
jgi:hypothetical protein